MSFISHLASSNQSVAELATAGHVLNGDADDLKRILIFQLDAWSSLSSMSSVGGIFDSGV